MVKHIVDGGRKNQLNSGISGCELMKDQVSCVWCLGTCDPINRYILNKTSDWSFRGCPRMPARGPEFWPAMFQSSHHEPGSRAHECSDDRKGIGRLGNHPRAWLKIKDVGTTSEFANGSHLISWTMILFADSTNRIRQAKWANHPISHD